MTSEALRIDETHWRARRVPLISRRQAGGEYVEGVDLDELCSIPFGAMEPGDYCGPTAAYTGGTPAIFFLLPIARDDDVHGPNRAFHHVNSPPHTFHEQPDGSIEVRASIGCDWHCWLDAGNVWRHP
jgi:hypothetical protein